MKKIIILFAFSFLFLLNGTSFAFASWNGSPYTPGATLTPECAPTDVACTVSAMPVSLGGTGVRAFAAGYIPFGAGTSALATSSTLYFDSINSRLGIGTATPAHKLDVTGDVNYTGILYKNGVASNPFLTNNTNNIWSSISGTPSHTDNFFVGYLAGNSATNAYSSNFLGNSAGSGATTASNSNFLGYTAGSGATTANNSNFFGDSAGNGATGANNSNFLGASAGSGATGANNSNFLGYYAGVSATGAKDSIFLGSYAGYNDTVNNTANSGTSIAIGRYSGTGGFSNSIALGRGVINSTAQQLNIGNVLYATGIYNSDTQSTSPTGGNVGIGTVTPGSALDVKGTLRLSGAISGFVGFAPAAAAGSTTYTLPSADGTAGQVLSTNASGVLSWAAAGGSSQWTTSGSKIFYNTGNVGIGTNDPVDRLQVGDGTADFRLSVMSNTTKQFTAKNASGNSVKYGASTDSLPNAVISNNDDTALMTILYGGNVGIGTTTPSAKLSVTGSGTGTGLAFNIANSSNASRFTVADNGGTAIAGTLFLSSGGLQFGNSGGIAGSNLGFLAPTSDGVFRFGDSGGGGSPRIILGSASSAFVSLLRSGTDLQVRLGDNSGYGGVDAGIIKLSGTNINTAGTLSNVAYLNQANVFTTGNTISRSGINNGNVPGLTIQNTSSASLGNQQHSPSFFMSGRGWATAGSASQSVDFITQVVPVQGSSNPTGYLAFSSQINNSGFTNILNITSGGNVGIGTTAPTSVLDVRALNLGVDNGTGNGGVYFGTTDSFGANIGGMMQLGGSAGADSKVSFGSVSGRKENGTINNFAGYLQFATNGAGGGMSEKVRITSTGNVGIGITTPADRLQVFGDVRLGTTGSNGCIKDFAGTGITGSCSSDERLKTNVVNLSDDYLDRMNNLKIITYNWNEQANALNKVDTTVTNYGLLAQNVEQFFPELITVDSNGYKQVNYSRLPLYLLKSLQELTKKVTGFAEQFTTKKLCVGTTCVTEEEFKTMVLMAGQTSSSSNTEPSAQIDEETTLPPPITQEETGPDENTYTTDTVDTGIDASSESSMATPSPASTEE